MFGYKATRKRIRLARSLERAAVPERPYIGRGPRYLVHPTITAACAPSLLAIAAALRNDPTAFSDDELKPVQSFITSCWSPFFGHDETAAMREAVRLQHSVLYPKPAVRDRAPVKQADAQAQSQSPTLTSNAGGTMNISTGTLLIAALLAAAVITAPAALGGQAPSSKSHLGQNAAGPASSGSLITTHQTATPSSLCPCNVGLPGGPADVGPRQLESVSSSPCPCNSGLPGGPANTIMLASPNSGGSIGHLGAIAPAPVIVKPRGGFDWGDASVGGGFIGCIGLLAMGAVLMLRKRDVQTDLQL